MKTNQTTKTIVKENTKDYQSIQMKRKVMVWILTMDGEVLIKTPEKKKKHVRITNLTIHNGNLKETITKVEKETGILCQQDLFKKIFSSKSVTNKNFMYDMYILCVNLDQDHKEFIEDNSKGKFVDYREIMTYLSKYELTPNCKDKLLTLIDALYEKYSFL